MMNKISKQISTLTLALVTLVLFCVMLSSCKDTPESTTRGDWKKVTPFAGAPRAGAVQFTIGDKVYVGLGYNANSSNSTYVQDGYFRDVYVFDAQAGNWSRIAVFPGDLRERAVAFSVNGVGYVGLGYNRKLNETELRDIWKYDPVADTWTKMTAEFGGSARYNAVAFSIGTKAYVGTGFDDAGNYNSDFYQYEATNDTWTQVASFPGNKRERAFAFVIDDKAYVAGGLNNDSYTTDFFQYNPQNNTWTNLEITDSDNSDYADFVAAVQRYDAVAFVMNGKAYIGTGVNAGAISKKIYEYDPASNAWDEMTPFEGSARSLAVAYVLAGRGFLGTGQYAASRYDDIWEFFPEADYDESTN